MRARAAALIGLSCSLGVWAELLPIRSYSSADGLAANQIDHIVVDSRGLIWFCTPQGLSRFDGHRFVTFGVDEGLPSLSIRSLLETRAGEYYVSTSRGLCRFRKGAGRQQFAVYTPGDTAAENSITALAESASGRLWCGTYAGVLFEVLPGPRFRRQAFTESTPAAITDLAEDGCGQLWVATDSGLFAMGKDGARTRIGAREGLPSEHMNALFRSRDGRLWAGVRGGLAQLRDGCGAGTPGVQQIYPAEAARRALAPPALNVLSLAEASDGELWASTADGLLRLLPDGTGIGRVTRAQGLTDRSIFSLASDKAGNLWAGTEGAGAMMLEPGGFTTFREADGLASDRVWSVFGDRAGKVLAVLTSPGFSLAAFDGARFRPFEAPRVFAGEGGARAWGMGRILLQSRTGEWWGATAAGLCRYPASPAEGLRNRAPEQCYFKEDTVFQVFEDSHGGVWASSQSTNGSVHLIRWDPAARTATAVPQWPATNALVKSFAEDGRGNLWMGLWSPGGLYRYDGRQFMSFGAKDGVPPGTIYSLLTDSRGRLWIGAQGGLGRIESPSDGQPRIRNYDQSSGLASAAIHEVLEDSKGYVYAASEVGIDRLDPTTGHIKHFSAADGVALGQMESAFRDQSGNLWFGTAQGLSRLTPAASRSPLQPAILITGVQAGGASLAISQRGETGISGIELKPDRNQLQVEFVALAGEPEANLRYAYKLEGGEGDWTAPRAQHTVNFAALSAGKYRFVVKAVNSDGVESAQPAWVGFTVLPPLWGRWWFELLALAAVASAAYLLHRYRVAQMVALERMRTSIATDLHDDIGSSLSQIAVLSEVARAGLKGESGRTHESLEKVAVLAREVVDSLSDIVWSIHPAPDGLDSLVNRMRGFANDLLSGQGIAFELRPAPSGQSALRVSLQSRRHLFLMFKECIHNISRHSGCTAARAELKAADREIVLTIEDNGHGWDPKQAPAGRGGTGIPGMARRAAMLGGALDMDSAPGRGCRVTIRIPLRRSAWARWRG